MDNEDSQVAGCIAWGLVVFVVLFIPGIIVDVCGIWPIMYCGIFSLIGGSIFVVAIRYYNWTGKQRINKMLEGRMIDKLVGEVIVVRSAPNECGIREDFDSEDTRIVGRKKAQKFVFEHLVAGCVCTTNQVQDEGRKGTVMHLWSTKPKEEKEK